MIKLLILLIISTLSLCNLNAQAIKQKITLEEIYKYYKFLPAGINNLVSMKDGEHYTLLNQGRTIDMYSYKTGNYIKNLVDIAQFEGRTFNSIDSYTFSADETKILITTKKEQIYRHSFSAEYYIYDLSAKNLSPISDNGKQQLATFSPDSRKVAFVRNNNIFWKDLETGKENQLTFDGEYNKIINGAPDWVYEEEFGFNKAFVWSVDSKKIGFYRFDESHVKQFNMTRYDDLYPSWYRFKYPKAGEENSILEIFVADLEKAVLKKMDIGSETDQYIPRIKWTKDPEIISILRLNRLQNHVEVLHGNVSSGNTEVVYEEVEEKYISEASDQMITYLDNKEEFLLISERENWYMIYLYNFKDGSLRNITDTGYDIHSLIGYDEDSRTVYYSSHERGTLYLDTWSVRIDGKKKKLLTKKKGWNDTEFSEGFEYYINTYSNINTPSYISLHRSNGSEIRVLEDNRALGERMERFNFSDAEFFSFEAVDNLELNGYIIKPVDFDSKKKYPLFMFVYGGPESQSVRDRFSAHRGAWFQYLVQQGYVVACVDNRGTNARGEGFRKSTYLQLGKYETIDQIAAAEYLGSKDFIDRERIGIFGWSYGGFMSLNCLFKAADIFKIAISVAPVTNWRFYDTIYTERFMRTPQENPEGYDQNSPIFFTDRMKGKLLLIHGMGDDNVHFQNSVELVKSLVESDKQFESQFYPNKNHGIYGGNTTFHLYTRMTDFVTENL